MVEEPDVCIGCGLFVGDWSIHRAWHRSVNQTAREAYHADAMTRVIGPRASDRWCSCDGPKHFYDPDWCRP